MKELVDFPNFVALFFLMLISNGFAFLHKFLLVVYLSKVVKQISSLEPSSFASFWIFQINDVSSYILYIPQFDQPFWQWYRIQPYKYAVLIAAAGDKKLLPAVYIYNKLCPLGCLYRLFPILSKRFKNVNICLSLSFEYTCT